MIRLHPFTGLALAVAAALLTLAADRWWLSLAVTTGAGVLAALAGAAGRLMLTAGAVLAPLWLSQLMVHALFDSAGSDVLFAGGPIRLTLEGLTTAGSLGLRAAAFVSVFLLYSLTVDRIELVRAIDEARVPAQLGYIVAATLALVPATADRARAIAQAQAVRGAGEGRGPAGWLRRKRLLAVPLVLSSIQDATERSVQLQLRGFAGGPGRTQYHPVPAKSWEKPVGLLVLCLAVAAAGFLAGQGGR
jgi:energy-coupling factor transport system permease protein